MTPTRMASLSMKQQFPLVQDCLSEPYYHHLVNSENKHVSIDDERVSTEKENNLTRRNQFPRLENRSETHRVAAAGENSVNNAMDATAALTLVKMEARRARGARAFCRERAQPRLTDGGSSHSQTSPGTEFSHRHHRRGRRLTMWSGDAFCGFLGVLVLALPCMVLGTSSVSIIVKK